ncbi:MAG: NAD-dependent epimerase/dehydratase family protein [Elusimicrobia bacterium]|nr:NAD-dependent epimerase/dehydratase family protein [Elusimicrobiota bacterium]
MRVGVLGGTRFIGVHLVRALLERGDEVAILHRGVSREPAHFPRSVVRVLGDRRDPSALDRFLVRPLDAVFDLSAYGPDDVAPVLARRGRFSSYAFVSTSSVYRVPPPAPYDESAPRVDADDSYGGSKRAAEDLVLASSRPGRPAISLRPQAVTGPWGAEQALHALRRAAAGTPVLVRPGTDGRRLCPLWVGDLVDALLRAVERPRAAGLALDLAGPDAVDPLGFVRAAAAACGGRAETLALPPTAAAETPWLGLPWLTHDLVASGALAASVLGGTRTPLEATLSRTWDWARRDARRIAPRGERGEADALAGRTTPFWRRAAWRAADAARTPLRAAKRGLRSLAARAEARA